MPLAKVIPIVNGLVYTILADAPNPFVQVIFLGVMLRPWFQQLASKNWHKCSIRSQLMIKKG